MSDDDAKKREIEESLREAMAQAADTSPQAANGESQDAAPGIDDLIPGLADAIEEAENETGEASGEPVTARGVIAQLEADCFELRDKLLRALAESENIRRRAERDRRDAETYGGTKLARDLLAVHDNLDRALAAADDTVREQAKGFIEGVELTQRELLNAFAKHKIEKVIPAMGEKFDPNRHQAMFEAPIPGAEPGTVMEVMQAGFMISDRLLRPAMVGVARAMPEPPPEASPNKIGEPDSKPNADDNGDS